MDWKALEAVMARLEAEFPAGTHGGCCGGPRSNSFTFTPDGNLAFNIWYDDSCWPFVFTERDNDYDKSVDELVADVRAFFEKRTAGTRCEGADPCQA